MTEPLGPGGSPRRMAFQWWCQVCKTDIGVATSDAVEMSSGIIKDAKSGKVLRKASSRSLVCAHCLGRGKITLVE